MTRPTPKPIKWIHTTSSGRLTTFGSELLDKHYCLFKHYYHNDNSYLYGFMDTRHPDDSLWERLYRPTPIGLVKQLRLWFSKGTPSGPLDETYAALASITSNEDWENLNE